MRNKIGAFAPAAAALVFHKPRLKLRLDATDNFFHPSFVDLLLSTYSSYNFSGHIGTSCIIYSMKRKMRFETSK